MYTNQVPQYVLSAGETARRILHIPHIIMHAHKEHILLHNMQVSYNSSAEKRCILVYELA